MRDKECAKNGVEMRSGEGFLVVPLTGIINSTRSDFSFMPELEQQIARLKNQLRFMGFEGIDYLSPGIGGDHIYRILERECPPLAVQELPEDSVAWFGWQNGFNHELADGHPDSFLNDMFTPAGVRFENLESALITSEIELEIYGCLEIIAFPVFSDLGGSTYGLVNTRAGWRLHFRSKDDPKWMPIPFTSQDLKPEDSPTLVEWLALYVDKLESGHIILNDDGYLVSTSAPMKYAAECNYPWL